jgi:REP element-mobilizing transposase RayT
MTYDPEKHHRHSTRLRDYDYSQGGAYFVTIVTHDRACVFGQIAEGEMQLSLAGQMTAQCWLELPERFPSVELDEYVVMPNHVHGIIRITDGNAVDLGEIVRTFKAVTSRNVRLSGLSTFGWQRNYHDHIVRNEDDLNSIREYIVYNPARWAEDEENTNVHG